MKPAYLSIFKYGGLILSCMMMIGMIAGMIGNKWIVTVLFFGMGVVSFFGSAILFYLDAIYETRNPNQPTRNPD